MTNRFHKIKSYRGWFFLSVIVVLLAISAATSTTGFAYMTDGGVYPPANYLSFQPPAKGGSYTDAVFGTAVKRLSDSMHTPRADKAGSTVNLISPEYSTMSPFNNDSTRLILAHFGYFGLYDGSGNYLKDLPFEINSSSEPRWSRKDANVLYFHNGVQLKQHNVGTGATSLVHAFTEYSSLTGKGESDISFDGNHFVFAGNDRYVFIYDIATNSKSSVFDTGGRAFDSLYMTADGNVTITWNAAGSARYTGIELFDKNMSFVRQLTHAGGHMDMGRDLNGDAVLLWAGGGDPQPVVNCGGSAIVKVRIADGKQTCLFSFGSWGQATHVSAADNSGWVFIESYVPADPIAPNGWARYYNEIVQVKIDGSEARRLVHHRSRPFDSYTYQPKVSASRDGSKIVYGSNFGLQKQIGNPAGYTDAYMIDLTASNGQTAPAPAPTTTPTTAPAPAPTPAPAPAPVTTPPTTTRVEQNASSVAYVGSWYPNSSSSHSKGAAVLSMDSNAKATFTFNGTGATWIAFQDSYSGIAKVFVDGVAKGTIDTYASPGKAQTRMYSVSGLSAGTHTLVVAATGTKRAGSGGAWIWVDAFESVSGGTTTVTAPATTTPTTPVGAAYRVDQTAAAVMLTGTWHNNSNAVHNGGSAKMAMGAGARATFKFTGTSVSWIGYKDPYSGIAKIYVDGVLKGQVDTYSASTSAKTILYAATGLSWGAHTITIEAAGTKNVKSGGAWTWVDAFDYFGAKQ